MELPFVGPSYHLESRPSGVQRTINMVPVPEEPGNERTAWVFKDVPGLVVFYEATELFIDDASGPATDELVFTLTVTRTGKLSIVSTVTWTATGNTFNGSEGFKRADDVYTGLLTFGLGETAKTLAFTLQVVSGIHFEATVTLSSPSTDTSIIDGVGELVADSPPLTLYHHHFDRPSDSTNWTDVQGHAWTPHVATPGGTLNQSGPAKFGAGAFYARNDTGSVPNIDIGYASIPLDSSGQNKFTIRGWVLPSGTGVSAIGVNLAGLFTRIEIQSAAAYLRGAFSSGAFAMGGTAISTSVYTFVEANYDGTNLRLFLNGVMIAKQAATPGDPVFIASGYVGQTSTSAGDVVRIDEAEFLLAYCWHPSDASYAVPTGPFEDTP